MREHAAVEAVRGATVAVREGQAAMREHAAVQCPAAQSADSLNGRGSVAEPPCVSMRQYSAQQRSLPLPHGRGSVWAEPPCGEYAASRAVRSAVCRLPRRVAVR